MPFGIALNAFRSQEAAVRGAHECHVISLRESTQAPYATEVAGHDPVPRQAEFAVSVSVWARSLIGRVGSWRAMRQDVMENGAGSVGS
nr:hypothetical protein StreXyl84_00820 [Streptomyces sp. Xyl84]